MLEPEESRHNDLELHGSRALTAQAATRGPTFFDGQGKRGEKFTERPQFLLFLPFLHYYYLAFACNVSKTPPPPPPQNETHATRDSGAAQGASRDGLRPLLALQPLPRKEVEVE